jgi:hypothetical protein
MLRKSLGSALCFSTMLLFANVAVAISECQAHLVEIW